MQGLKAFRGLALAVEFLAIVAIAAGAKHHIATAILAAIMIGVISIEITTTTKNKTKWTRH